VGKLILAELIRLGRLAGHSTIVAIISADQTPSLKLHESLGFTTCGVIKRSGYKFNQWLDAVYMQILL